MSSRSVRLATGLALAIAVGAFGPLQFAVSIESRTVIEVAGPTYDGSSGHIATVYQNSREGAGARWEIPDGEDTIIYTLLAARGVNTHADTDASGDPHARVGTDRAAVLEVRRCRWYEYDEEGRFYSCSLNIWKGADTFTRDRFSEDAAFAGTLLHTEDGTSCDISAVWRATAGHEVRSSFWTGRLRRPAQADITTSCIGEHHLSGPDEAEIWTEHVAIP